MIIDVHVHTSPADARGTPAFIEQCRRNGVSLVLVSSLGRWSRYPPSDEVRAANDEARACVGHASETAAWLAYVNPQNPDWRAELDRCAAGGAVGVKLWVSLKDTSGGVANTEAVLGTAGEKGLPALVHTFHKTDGNLPGELTLEEFARLAERCPETTLIAAHAGGNWRQSLGVLRHRAPNAAVDVSGCFPERGMVEALAADVGADRIVFGSDMMGRTLASQLAKVVFAGIPEEQKEQILCRNALRIFGSAIHPENLPPALPLRPKSELPDPATDHFCFCGRWPFFETPCTTPAELDRLLADHGIRKAYVGDLGSIYRVDMERANRQFAAAARAAQRVAPLAVLSPRAANWQHVIRGLDPAFTGAIVYPYLHNWRLDDPAVEPFFQRCADLCIPLWVNCQLGDRRHRHPGLACRPVAADELARFARRAPRNTYVFQGLTAPQMGAVLVEHAGDARFRFEISKLTDHSGALDEIAGKFGLRQLLMGSEFPLRDLRETRWAARRV